MWYSKTFTVFSSWICLLMATNAHNQAPTVQGAHGNLISMARRPQADAMPVERGPVCYKCELKQQGTWVGYFQKPCERTVCQMSETCALKAKVSRDGSTRYQFGCMKTKDCSNPKPRADIQCQKCCSSDHCNTLDLCKSDIPSGVDSLHSELQNMLPVNGSMPALPGTLCYKCEMKEGALGRLFQPCGMTVCRDSESCAVTTKVRKGGVNPTYQFGCMKTQDCNKRKKGADTTCQQCCSDDKCNTKNLCNASMQTSQVTNAPVNKMAPARTASLSYPAVPVVAHLATTNTVAKDNVCYSCKIQSQGAVVSHKCRQRTVCDESEACSIKVLMDSSGDKVEYNYGCMKLKDCAKIRQTNDVPCHVCCTGDHCNTEAVCPATYFPLMPGFQTANLASDSVSTSTISTPVTSTNTVPDLPTKPTTTAKPLPSVHATLNVASKTRTASSGGDIKPVASIIQSVASYLSTGSVAFETSTTSDITSAKTTPASLPTSVPNINEMGEYNCSRPDSDGCKPTLCSQDFVSELCPHACGLCTSDKKTTSDVTPAIEVKTTPASLQTGVLNTNVNAPFEGSSSKVQEAIKTTKSPDQENGFSGSFSVNTNEMGEYNCRRLDSDGCSPALCSQDFVSELCPHTCGLCTSVEETTSGITSVKDVKTTPASLQTGVLNTNVNAPYEGSSSEVQEAIKRKNMSPNQPNGFSGNVSNEMVEYNCSRPDSDGCKPALCSQDFVSELCPHACGLCTFVEETTSGITSVIDVKTTPASLQTGVLNTNMNASIEGSSSKVQEAIKTTKSPNQQNGFSINISMDTNGMDQHNCSRPDTNGCIPALCSQDFMSKLCPHTCGMCN